MKGALVIFLLLPLKLSWCRVTRHWHRSRNIGPQVPEWNHLSVTWMRWESLPQNPTAATAKGWRLTDICGDAPHFRGNRYILGEDKTVMLLFDNSDKLAGIQSAIPKTQVSSRPSPWFMEGDTYVITAYLKDPDSICTRTESNSKNLGEKLLIQSGPSPKEYLQVPIMEGNINSSKWIRGQCFWTMGQLYWYNFSKDANCTELFPVFLMYTNSVLSGFGWFVTERIESSRYVVAGSESFPYLFKNATIPKCLWTAGHLSLQHIYLDNNPYMNIC